MKKIILILTALVLMVSGVAAVSAYEAHLINVKAHVENALAVDVTEIDFGTVFPEEWLVQHREIQLSESAIDELADDLVSVAFKFYAEWKLNTDTTDPLDFYNWMGYFTYVGYDVDDTAAQMSLVGPPPALQPGAKSILGGPFVLSDALPHNVYVAIDVPVFDGFYNSLTDMLQEDGTYIPKPSGLMDPTYIIYAADWPDFDPEGMDFGLDLKIQVTDIVRGVAD